MNIYFCNINTINENVEDFVIAKNKIEKSLIEKEEIEKKMTIFEFLEYVNLTGKIFICNDEQSNAIPFNIYNTNNDELVIIFSSTNTDNDNIFKDHLLKIQYNIDNLKKISEIDLIQGKIKNSEYYIIDNNYYID